MLHDRSKKATTQCVVTLTSPNGAELLGTLFVKATLGEYIDGDGTLWQMAYQLMPLASSNGTELLGSIWVLVGFF